MPNSVIVIFGALILMSIFSFSKPIYCEIKNMVTPSELQTNINDIKTLKKLYSQVDELVVGKYNKDKILNVINFEIGIIEYVVFKELGKKAYDEMEKK
jgi:hypothetical protein